MTMTITLTLGDFLVIAAIVLILTHRVQGYFTELAPEQLRMQRQLDAIMKHLGLTDPPVSGPGALSPQVAALAAAGRKIEAIRLYRRETGAGLKAAKAAVEAAPATAAMSQ